MKKFLILFFIFFLPCVIVYGQGVALTFDVALNNLMEISHAEQVIYYAQMIAENVQQTTQFVQMLENFAKQAERTMQNLASAGDINSWDDFMSWYNRQLYLEKQTAETFDNMNVTIGKKQYHLTDIEGMVYGAKDTYVDYWDKEFTEEQRKEMWLGLGLTPSNYAYVQPFRARAREITKEGLTAVPIQNEWYQRNMQRNKERQDKLAADKNKPTEQKMGSKEITMMILESLMETNKVMNDVAMNQALEREDKAVKDSLDRTPVDTPLISDYPGKDDGIGFRRLK